MRCMSIVQHQEVEDYLKFQASLGYVVSSRLAWAENKKEEQ